MKKLITISLSLLLTITLFAQSSNEAKTILDKAYNNYQQSKGIKIEFSFSAIENNDAYIQQSGTAMVKGNKFKIEADDVNTWFDGKTQWVLLKDYNEVNISEPTLDEIASISPTALLSMYKAGYTLKKPTTKTINKKSAHIIEMIPTSSGSDFKDISVAIDKSNNTILEINLTLKNGVKNKISISSYNTNYNFSDIDFTFDKNKHPKVEVIDLR